MAGWNLPPGCNEWDIPGNRPIDEAFENFLNSPDCPDTDNDEELEAAFQKWLAVQESF